MTLEARRRSWNPGLDNERQTLLALYQEMPGEPARAVPWLMWALQSVVGLRGRVDVFSQDCLHLLLGRGVLPQDEAFVLGFTLGSRRDSRAWRQALLAWSVDVESLDRIAVEVFHFGVEAARSSGCAVLGAVDFHQWLERPIGQVRSALSIDTSYLRGVYQTEAQRWPLTWASRRLPRARREGTRLPSWSVKAAMG